MTKAKRSTAKRSPAKQKTLKDQLDGAQYWGDDKKAPYEYMIGEDGLRPGETTAPGGVMVTDLTIGINGRTIPPRFIWDEGNWKGNKKGEFNVWVVSGEGTPGNYKTREYKVPERIAQMAQAEHPADWFESEKEGRKYGSTTSWGGSGRSDSLPWGLRIRCLGCGHFFKETDLKTHIQAACPAKQGDMVLWIQECECHPDDLLAACEILDGFPMKPPETPGPESGGKLDEDLGAEAAAEAAAAKN